MASQSASSAFICGTMVHVFKDTSNGSILYSSTILAISKATLDNLEYIQAVSQEPALWEAQHRRRWQLPISFGSNKETYKERHLLDRQVTVLIHQLPSEKNKEGLADCFEAITSLPRDAIEYCWSVSRDDEDAQARTLARALVRLLHCVSAFDNLVRLRSQAFDCERERLEEYATGVSRMFYFCNDPTDTTSKWISEHLDEIAANIQTRFPSHDESSEVEKPEIIIRGLEMQFWCGDQVAFENLLLHSVLQRMKASARAFPILCICIGRRIGLQVDMFRSSKGFFLGVATLNRYQYPRKYLSRVEEGLELMSPDEIIDHKVDYLVCVTGDERINTPRACAAFSMHRLFRQPRGLVEGWESMFSRAMSNSFARAYFNKLLTLPIGRLCHHLDAKLSFLKEARNVETKTAYELLYIFF